MHDVQKLARGFQLIADIRNSSPKFVIPDFEHNGIRIKEMDSIPPGSNPYLYDSYNMGCDINKDIHAMFSSTGSYIILIFNKTGRRIHISFDEEIVGRTA